MQGKIRRSNSARSIRRRCWSSHSSISAASGVASSAAALGVAAAAVARFFKPIMGAIQKAVVRRLDQAWQKHDDEPNVEERVRKAAKDVRLTTRFPMTQSFVEDRIRKQRMSEPPS